MVFFLSEYQAPLITAAHQSLLRFGWSPFKKLHYAEVKWECGCSFEHLKEHLLRVVSMKKTLGVRLYRIREQSGALTLTFMKFSPILQYLDIIKITLHPSAEGKKSTVCTFTSSSTSLFPAWVPFGCLSTLLLILGPFVDWGVNLQNIQSLSEKICGYDEYDAIAKGGIATKKSEVFIQNRIVSRPGSSSRDQTSLNSTTAASGKEQEEEDSLCCSFLFLRDMLGKQHNRQVLFQGSGGCIQEVSLFRFLSSTVDLKTRFFLVYIGIPGLVLVLTVLNSGVVVMV